MAEERRNEGNSLFNIESISVEMRDMLAQVFTPRKQETFFKYRCLLLVRILLKTRGYPDGNFSKLAVKFPVSGVKAYYSNGLQKDPA